jgi:hypothetical protein
MRATDMVDTGVLMARIAAARVVGPSSLEVSWNDGSRTGRTETVDLTAILGRYRVCAPLRDDPGLFATARVIEDGDAIAWNGPDLEMSADLIETVATQSARDGAPPPRDLSDLAIR